MSQGAQTSSWAVSRSTDVTLYGPQDAPACGPGIAGRLVLGRAGRVWALGTGTVTRITLSRAS